MLLESIRQKLPKVKRVGLTQKAKSSRRKISSQGSRSFFLPGRFQAPSPLWYNRPFFYDYLSAYLQIHRFFLEKI